MNNFNDIKNQFKPAIILWFKRIYVVAFNIYAWYWLYRQIFVRHSDDFEEYLLWFFTTAGMHYFVLDSKDIFFKKK
ncbi:MAG TPA: hypothetical protein VGF30_06090 [Bacteroidia bacterium]